MRAWDWPALLWCLAAAAMLTGAAYSFVHAVVAP